jgi:hypothetical protein
MLEFTYRVAIKKRVKAVCQKHPRFDPETKGRGGIVGGCTTCAALCDLQETRLKLDAAVREFERRAAPWVVVRRKVQ